MKMKTIEELVETAYETARSRGFHETPVEFGTLIALIHTEVTEVLEAKTPEHQTEEFADILIRIFDMCGDKSIPLANIYQELLGKELLTDIIKEAQKIKINEKDLSLMCLQIHTLLTQTMEMYRLDLLQREKEVELAKKLYHICQYVFGCAGVLEADIEKAILTKMEKNKKRAYKHGKII